MHRRICCAMALAVAMLPANAQDSDLAQLRNELKALQQRIQELEQRLSQKETTAAPEARPSGFNPEISLILQGTLGRSSRDPETYRISGFAPSGGEVAPAPRGFSLGESELVLSANVDPYFRGHLAAALTPDNQVEVEEAYFQTLALGRGLTVKGGRFLSGVGYLNEIHQHAWDFQDAPLAYKAFLAGRLNDDGVQVRWVAPTDIFLELGSELGRARSFPGSNPSRNGAGAWSLFGHLGGDFDASTAWRAGLSYLGTSPRNRAFTDQDSTGTDVTQSFSGRSRLWIADFVLKGAKLKLQGEYFRRRETGALTYADTFTDRYASRQSGWYLQSAYEFMPQWRVGYRYDRLNHGSVENAIVANGLGPTAADFPLLMADHNPTRNTFMVDWSPSEFSRFRLQYARDNSRLGIADNQLLLQYIHSLGAHGAHKF
jgi:hypothetical protein